MLTELAPAVYAYIPSYTGFCSQSDVMCNQEYGTSLSRGTFSFTRGGQVDLSVLLPSYYPS